MASRYVLTVGLFTSFLANPLGAGENTKPMHTGPACMADDPFFEQEVWAKVGERVCMKCHVPDGDAEDSEFLLQDPSKSRTALSHNRSAFLRMAALRKDGKSRLLVKVTGGLDHGGGQVLKPDSTSYRILERFILRRKNATDKPGITTRLSDDDIRSFFEGIEMVPADRLLRRVTLSLAARLPTEEELALVREQGLDAMPGLLDRILKEDAFYMRLKEGFNDIFLTLGYEGNGEEALSYEHFEKTRLWYQKYDLSSKPEKERQRTRWALADVYRDAMRREPLELIAHIVRNEHPFTELVTADYILVSPYTARGYGIFDKLRPRFKDPDDPFEYIPAKLPALRARNGKVQESPTGFYPHAGLLSTFQYLRRYPTTETNRNRLRSRMYYQHFLGIDVMALAPRVTDAAAVTAQHEIPTMQAPDCVVCHKSVDPVAGLFQVYNKEGHLGPRKEGWYTDMFGAGFEGDALPKTDHWRALQWLGQRTATDPRFAVAMVEHVYYILMGRNVLQPPEDVDDPMFQAKRRAYLVQRKLIGNVARRFAVDKFDLKVVFKALVLSPFYRADGLATAEANPKRIAELDDVGVVRLLTPEQLERKIEAIFGQKWGRLQNRDSRFEILYGGIDSKSVTERMTDPSGAMGAIQRILANEVACKNVGLDFTRKPSERILFPNIEPEVVPDDGPEAESKIRKAIVHLHQRLLGRLHAVNHPEVERTYALFVGILEDAKEAKGIDKRGSYFCERIEQKRLDDPHYTIRAWRGVVTYLLRQHDFLYE